MGAWVRACVCVSVTLYLVDTIATTVFALSPRNSVGGDIVTRPFVGGWVSE